ncbi:MAG: PorT family protein [Saprospiraceae bacterium]|uniref:PorT family protein n=1 Tax=Candidatus Opimibacter skivensis TaxID=2982028 RepID=A0A9D7STW1_9BACT|nr:PorT family protein [Candidatus Opimibacter skivensis]
MKLKKPLICLPVFLTMIVVFALVSPVYGQRFSAAVTGGINACQIDGDMLAGYDKVGLTGGIRAIINFESRLGLNVEFLYSQRGSRPDIFNPDYDPDININLVYAELPVYATLGDWWQEEGKYYKVSVQAGFSYGRLINARTFDYFHTSDMNLDKIVPFFNNNDISWLVGLSYRLGPHWGLTGRYTRGITPLLSPAKHNLATEKLVSYFISFRGEYYF